MYTSKPTLWLGLLRCFLLLPGSAPGRNSFGFPTKSRDSKFPSAVLSAAALAPLLHTRQARQQLLSVAGVLYLNHTRASLRAAWLLRAKAAFHYSGQSSLSSLWGIRLQDQTLLSVWSCSNRRAREFCLCRDRFVPGFPLGKLLSMLWKPWAMGILVGVNYICQT